MSNFGVIHIIVLSYNMYKSQYIRSLNNYLIVLYYCLLNIASIQACSGPVTFAKKNYQSIHSFQQRLTTVNPGYKDGFNVCSRQVFYLDNSSLCVCEKMMSPRGHSINLIILRDCKMKYQPLLSCEVKRLTKITLDSLKITQAALKSSNMI